MQSVSNKELHVIFDFVMFLKTNLGYLSQIALKYAVTMVPQLSKCLEFEAIWGGGVKLIK